MSKVASVKEAVKEAVKETLVGSHEPAQLSAQTRARFNRYAVKDPETGELYLGPEQFIDAIAPPNEDYVSCSLSLSLAHSQRDLGFCLFGLLAVESQCKLLTGVPNKTAQDQAGAVLDPVSRRRPDEQGQSHPCRLGVL